jgi:hypothetical protein
MAIQSFRKDDTERDRISDINYINSINIKLYYRFSIFNRRRSLLYVIARRVIYFEELGESSKHRTTPVTTGEIELDWRFCCSRVLSWWTSLCTKVYRHNSAGAKAVPSRPSHNINMYTAAAADAMSGRHALYICDVRWPIYNNTRWPHNNIQTRLIGHNNKKREPTDSDHFGRFPRPAIIKYNNNSSLIYYILYDIYIRKAAKKECPAANAFAVRDVARAYEIDIK